jgi:hypothetical protein
MRNSHSFDTMLAAANHAAFGSSACAACECECAMCPIPGMLWAAAVTSSSAVCSGPSGTAWAVSASAESRSESECEPIPRAPPMSRMATSPVPTVSNFARPKGYRRLGGRRDRRHENKTTKSPKRSIEKWSTRQHEIQTLEVFQGIRRVNA